MHVYSEVSPADFNGIEPRIRALRTTALNDLATSWFHPVDFSAATVLYMCLLNCSFGGGGGGGGEVLFEILISHHVLTAP